MQGWIVIDRLFWIAPYTDPLGKQFEVLLAKFDYVNKICGLEWKVVSHRRRPE